MQTCFPVVDETGKFNGIFSLNNIRPYLYDGEVRSLAIAYDLATTDIEPLIPDTNLSTAMSRFAQVDFDELPIVDPKNPEFVVGMLRRKDLIAAYHARLKELRRG